jgi:hypothetical protein
VVARLFFIVAAHVGQMLSVRERLISPINIYTGRCVRCACAEWVGGWPPPSLFVCVSRNPGHGRGDENGTFASDTRPEKLVKSKWTDI